MAATQGQPWVVLGLDASWFPELAAGTPAASISGDSATRSALVRRAYRRALLQHHPDKQAEGESPEASYTIDEIKAAYAALGGAGGTQRKAVLGGLAAGSTATGLEIVDLDELPFDLVVTPGTADDPVQTWYRSCRCGNARGFTFTELDLEEELDAEAMETLAGGDAASAEPTVGELMVGCQDCSLWLCVHFAAMPDSDEDDDDDEYEQEEADQDMADK